MSETTNDILKQFEKLTQMISGLNAEEQSSLNEKVADVDLVKSAKNLIEYTETLTERERDSFVNIQRKNPKLANGIVKLFKRESLDDGEILLIRQGLYVDGDYFSSKQIRLNLVQKEVLDYVAHNVDIKKTATLARELLIDGLNEAFMPVKK